MGAKEQRGGTAQDRTVVGRRSFLVGAVGFLGCAISSHPVFAAVAGLKERRIVLSRSQFGESFSGIYWQDGQYVPEALSEISRLFREPKNGAIKSIDPELLDGLLALQKKLGTTQNFDLLSGFRQPTPADAKQPSYHHVGKAADIRLAGRSAQQIFEAARSLQIGGVGRYAGKSFVHVDTGAFRTWAWGYGKSAPAKSTPAKATQVKASGSVKAASPVPLPRPR